MSSNVSSRIELSLTVSSINGPSLTLIQKTLRDFDKLTSLLEEGFGPSPRVWPDGLTTRRSGPAPARASRSLSQEKDLGRTIHGICGPTSFASSEPSGPLSSWVNRLQDRLATVGSTELPLIWREKATPAGRSIFRLAPSTRRTSASGSTGAPSKAWTTPQAHDAALPDATRWGRHGTKHGGRDLNDEAAMVAAPWPTPVAHDDNKSPEAHLAMKKRMGERDGTGANRTAITSLQVMAKATVRAPWSSPTVRDSGSIKNVTRGAGSMARGQQIIEPLVLQAAATWPTPMAQNPDAENSDFSRSMEVIEGMRPSKNAPRFGQTTSGEPAQMEKPGALNPEFVFWVMGFPIEFQHSVLQAMQSWRPSRRKSSKP